MTNIRREHICNYVYCMQYLIQFCQKNNKDKNKNISILINLNNRINILYITNNIKSSFYTIKMNNYILKIDRSDLNTLKMVIADY